MATPAMHEAVLFFDKKGVAKEMLYSEFESILDGLLPVPEMASRNHEAAFVSVDGSLHIKGIVFFTIAFDAQGFADKKWNVPLRSLLNKGVEGPDLGAGAIRVYMQGIDEAGKYTKYLWDPDERGGSNDLIHLRNAIRNNHLCLLSDGSDDAGENDRMGNPGMVMREEPAVPKQVARKAAGMDDVEIPMATSTLMNTDNDEFSQAIKIIESQRIRITALENALKKSTGNAPDLSGELAKAKQEADEFKEQLQVSETALKESKKSTKAFEKQISELEDALKKSEQALKQSEKKAKTKLEEQKKKYASDLKSSNKELEESLKEASKKEQEALTQEHEEQLAEQKQLHQKLEQQLESFKKELTELRGDKFRLVKNGTEEFFNKIAAADISFMAFRPGTGHMTIPLKDIGVYMESPNEYCAKKCNMSLEEYETWLSHYNNPVCTAPLPGDKICGEHIKRVDAPANYTKGSSDRCSKHGGQ